MATMGDLNPDLYKKSALQLANEARNANSNPGVTNSSNNPTLNNTPDKLNIGNPISIIESNAGYTTMSGQRTASNSQLEETRKSVAQDNPVASGVGKTTEQPTYFNRLATPGQEFETRVQDKAPDTRGLFYDTSTGQTNNPYYVPFDVNKQLKGVTNVNKDMYGKMEQLQYAYKNEPDFEKKQQLIAEMQLLQNNPEYIAAQNAAKNQANAQSQINQSEAAQNAAMGAANTHATPTSGVTSTTPGQSGGGSTTETIGGGGGALGGGMTGGGGTPQNISSTGVAQYDQALGMQNQLFGVGADLAQQTKATQDNAVRNQMLLQLQGTTVAQQAQAQGKNLASMTLQELENFTASVGIELTPEMKDKLQAGGKAQLETQLISKNDQMAQIGIAQKQAERAFNRALDEREQYNIQQDVMLRNMMASRGMGTQDLSMNVEVMRKLDEGVKAKAELAAQFADNTSLLANQANTVIKTYANNVSIIQSQMAAVIENKYAEISKGVSDLIDKGVTNETELNKALFGLQKDFVTTYTDTMEKAATYIQKENENFFNQQIQLRKLQQDDDQALTNATGQLYKNNKPVLDQFGNFVPTLDGMKFNNEVDKMLTEQSGYVYQNGMRLLDSKGQPIETFDREKYATDTMFKQQGYNLDVAKFNQDVQQFGLDYAQRQAKIDQDKYQFEQTFSETQRKNMFDITNKMVESGALPAKALNAFTPNAVVASTYDFIPNKGARDVNGKALGGMVQNLGDRIAQAAEWAKKTVIPAECVGYVRKIIPDLPTGLYTLADKLNKIGSVFPAVNTPQPGDVMVQSTGQAPGHVAVVSGYDPSTGKIAVSEYNWKAGQVGARLLDINDPSLEGFFRPPNVKVSGGGQDNNEAKSIAEEMMSPYSQFKLSDITDKAGGTLRADVSKELTKMKAEAMKSGDVFGMVRASAGGKTPSDTFKTNMSLANNVIDELGSLETLAGATYTDPIIGALRNKIPYDQQASLIQQKITQLTPSLARGIFKEVGVLTDQDVARYQQTIPNLQTPNGAKQLLLQATKDVVARSIMNSLKSEAAGGSDVSGYGYLLEALGTSAKRNFTNDQKRAAWDALNQAGYDTSEENVIALLTRSQQ